MSYVSNRFLVNKEPIDSESIEDLHMTEIAEVVAGMNELWVWTCPRGVSNGFLP
jgi:hypothetical protein